MPLKDFDVVDQSLIDNITRKASMQRHKNAPADKLGALAAVMVSDLEQQLRRHTSELNTMVIDLLGRVLREFRPDGDEARTSGIEACYKAIIFAHLAPPELREEAMQLATLDISTIYLRCSEPLALAVA